MTMCPLCNAEKETTPVPHPLREGFILGIIVQRIAEMKKVNVASIMCTQHLADVRRLVATIPDTVIPATLRPALLNFGLSVVS